VILGNAGGVLINVTVRPKTSASEVMEAVDFIAAAAKPAAKVLFSGPVNENLQNDLRITVITTGTADLRT